MTISNALLDTLRAHVRNRPGNGCALSDGRRELGYRELLAEIEALAAVLERSGVKTLGLYADNGIGWIVADLAAMAADIRCVPLPRFFSDAQLRHAVADSGVDALLTMADDPRVPQLLQDSITAAEALRIADEPWTLARCTPAHAVTLPARTQKITYTSGTTGAPKGVCLAANDLLSVAASLLVASGAGADERHLCVLPLSTLLENLGGVYAPLFAGATVCVPPQAEVGMDGAAGLDPQRLIAALHRFRASTTILVPQILMALVSACERGAPRPALRFAAVGGAPVSARLLERAQRLGLPVFEGYGLSECASVVALNTPAAFRSGSVGRVLPHAQVRIADDGEILVRGTGFLGYTGAPARAAGEWVASGDLGSIDADGFLQVTGRKKNMFVTAFGRNVAPEWVERELTQHAVVAHAAVFGEGRPWNAAVVVPRTLPGVDTDAALAAAIAAANRELPDYARIRRWLTADTPFTPDNGLLTTNGRVRRAEVQARYSRHLESLYLENPV